MAKYRKKPVVVEAMLLEDSAESADGIIRWANWHGVRIIPGPAQNSLTIPTLEGTMEARPGDYIIKGVKDEFYPCKPDVFAATYEPVDGQ